VEEINQEVSCSSCVTDIFEDIPPVRKLLDTICFWALHRIPIKNVAFSGHSFGVQASDFLSVFVPKRNYRIPTLQQIFKPSSILLMPWISKTG
jgi:hypothetical protein